MYVQQLIYHADNVIAVQNNNSKMSKRELLIYITDTHVSVRYLYLYLGLEKYDAPSGKIIVFNYANYFVFNF